MRNLFGSSAVAAAFAILLASSAPAQTAGAKGEDDLKTFENVIQTFLEGNDMTPLRGMIHPEAYIVHGESYESIFELMSVSSRRQLFGSAEQNRMKFFHAYINDANTTAFVVVKMEAADGSNPRFHTVVFVKSAGKGWQVRHWHAGSKS